MEPFSLLYVPLHELWSKSLTTCGFRAYTLPSWSSCFVDLYGIALTTILLWSTEKHEQLPVMFSLWQLVTYVLLPILTQRKVHGRSITEAFVQLLFKNTVWNVFFVTLVYHLHHLLQLHVVHELVSTIVEYPRLPKVTSTLAVSEETPLPVIIKA